MTTKSLITINNNLMCGLDLETTGLDPSFHEIIQIALLPLDKDLEPRKDCPPFDFKIRPEHPDRIDMEALRISKNDLGDIMETGFPSEKVKELFYAWFDRLNIGESKKIVPLGHNIAQFDLNFIREWLGGVASYRHYFHGHCRDTMQVAIFWNDKCEFDAEQTMFPKLTLKEMARKLGVEVKDEISHDALYDAYIASQCYKKACRSLFNL